MLKLNQKGALDPIVIILLILVLAMGGYIGYTILNKDKEEAPAEINQTNQQSTEINENESSDQQDSIPEGWEKYDSEGLNISVYFPSNWRVDTCDEATGFFVLIEKEGVKCATEDWSDGPIFGATDDIVTKCELIDPTNEIQTKTCKISTIGGEEVIVEEYTFIKEGAFAEPIGTKYYTYNFTNQDLGGLKVDYLHYPEAEDQTDTIVQSLATIEKLN